ncbi:MAG: hypothetical protein LBC31_11690 [Treponema sp.]|jgi:hypothetical protein|nr:hypothetical protein [Treponema sp.]
MRQRASKKVTLSLTDAEWKEFYAYALVKGYGTSTGIASLARTAIVEKIARNAPTAAQRKRIEEIIGNPH